MIFLKIRMKSVNGIKCKGMFWWWLRNNKKSDYKLDVIFWLPGQDSNLQPSG